MDPENHRSYWYEDGDIVIIAANTFKFRVHKNKLAIHSSVLKARTVAPHQEVIDGYPTIRLDDDADDVGCMLQGIYDTRAFDAEQLSFDFVSASLRLGTKYKIGSIRVNAIARLTAFWPNTLAEYDRGRAQDSTCINMCYNDAYAEEFVAAQLALTYDIPELLPVVLYGCCTWTTDNLADALKRTEKKFGHTTPLPSLDLLSMVTKGAVELTKLRGKVLFAFLDGELSGRCTTTENCGLAIHDALRKAFEGELLADTKALDDSIDTFIRANSKRDCKHCRAHWIARYRKGREEVWARLPFCFGLELSNEQWPAQDLIKDD